MPRRPEDNDDDRSRKKPSRGQGGAARNDKRAPRSDDKGAGRKSVKRSPSSAKRSAERRSARSGDDRGRERTGRPEKRTGGSGRPERRSGGSGRPEKRAGSSSSSGRPAKRTGGGGRPTKRTSSAAPVKKTARAAQRYDKKAPRGGRDKRTSRNTDERNPTRSGIEYPSRKTRPVGGAAPEPELKPGRASLRKVRSEPAPEKTKRTRKAPVKAGRPLRRKRSKQSAALDELARVAGRGATRAQDTLTRAAEAYSAGRERDAARMLRPLRDSYPDVAAIRELLGLCQYRLGNFDAATTELEAFVELTGDVEQHPVLMDCARAKRKYRRVDELWRELADASPSAALVIEGRIVLAGSLADRGRLQDAISTLEKRGGTQVQRVQDHHLRLWYVLADLYERAGDIPAARQLFLHIRKADASFADVAERLAALN